MSAPVEFPDPRSETNEGIIAVGGRLTSENLIEAYSNGIFPWPHEGYPLLWFCPDERGIIEFDEVHPPKSFMKWYRKNRQHFKITVNQDFPAVIKSCRVQRRPDQQGTWITAAMEKAYIELNKAGHALSLEVWNDEMLVGGIYGVQTEMYFSCESMFFKVSNASKLALYELIQHLQSEGQAWMDIQMVTSVSESFGGKLIAKDDFLDRIDR